MRRRKGDKAGIIMKKIKDKMNEYITLCKRDENEKFLDNPLTLSNVCPIDFSF